MNGARTLCRSHIVRIVIAELDQRRGVPVALELGVERGPYAMLRTLEQAPGQPDVERVTIECQPCAALFIRRSGEMAASGARVTVLEYELLPELTPLVESMSKEWEETL